jgi:pimeloyl-ACP methyl ester carboxylesterase
MTSVTGRVRSNGIEIAYDSFGDPSDPAILLVMGLGTQRLAWPDDLCRELADGGHLVIRFDNRDCGESTHFSDGPTPSRLDIVLRRRTPYHLRDMAHDAIGLLDALGIDRVHLVGASMGGFIAQTIALHQPERLRSLTLMMTSTGSRRVGRPHLPVLWKLLRRRPETDRERVVQRAVDTYRLIGSPGYPFDEAHVRVLAGMSFERAHDPDAYQRHVAAILAQPDRTRSLHRITLPTLVMHGLADRLVDPTGGLALARTIPRATFIGFSGMGHDLPRALWPVFAKEITALASGADGIEPRVRRHALN